MEDWTKSDELASCATSAVANFALSLVTGTVALAAAATGVWGVFVPMVLLFVLVVEVLFTLSAAADVIVVSLKLEREWAEKEEGEDDRVQP